MKRDQAMQIVEEFVKNTSLIHHMLAVESVMRYYAKVHKEDEETWAICGLLHDFDWEIHPSLEEHPVAGAPLLRDRDVPEHIIHAILTHADHTGIPRVSIMEKALYACDEITGLVTAVALVRPSRSLYDLEVNSIKKKWKDKAFAAGANRIEMEQAAREFNIDLWEHVSNVIFSMRNIAPIINLAGNLQTTAS